jgi:hypothetical protein
MEHLNEDQIDGIVLGTTMRLEMLDHLFDCDECFLGWENTVLLVSALRLPHA